MDVRNCSKCGRLFNYICGQSICDACKERLEDDFQRVKDYIWENPKANMQDICEVNDVTTNQIRQWIREERLQLTPDSPVQLQCENCGNNILTGRFCQECKNKMARGLDNAFEKPKPKPKERPKAEGREGRPYAFP